MKTNDVLKDLGVAIKNNQAPLIASKMNFKSSMTPYMWHKRSRVPAWNVKRLREVLNEIRQEEKSDRKRKN